MTAPPSPLAGHNPGGGEVTLAFLLNILWRRKWIVILLTGLGLAVGVLYGQLVTPLYRATATVRPGITAYTPEGGPVREWMLKDVTHWFQRGMYRKRLGEKLELPEYKRVIINADFILRGLQNIQGGNVITLTTLDPDPGQAETILTTAIESFNEYALADTVSSQLELTRNGLKIKIAGLQNQIELVESKKAKLDLDIAVARAESSQVEAEMKLLDLDIRKRQVAREYLTTFLTTLAAESLAIARQEESILQAWPDKPGGQYDNLGDLMQGAAQLQVVRFRNRALADSARFHLGVNDIEISELRIKRDQELAIKKANLHRQIESLRLDRDRKLAHEAAGLQNEILEKRVQLATLSPIQKVGEIQVSRKPVRPRKLRAISILTVLSLLGSLVVSFGWEYVTRHRSEIFQGQNE